MYFMIYKINRKERGNLKFDVFTFLNEKKNDNTVGTEYNGPYTFVIDIHVYYL